MGIAIDKSRAFAIRIVRLCQYLRTEKREFVISDQLLRSGTSIGANLTEASFAISKKEFLSKVYISLKECAETNYWLDLLHDTGYLSIAEYKSIHDQSVEILKMLHSTTRTIRREIKDY